MYFKRIPNTNWLEWYSSYLLDGLKQFISMEFGRNVDVRISIRPGPE